MAKSELIMGRDVTGRNVVLDPFAAAHTLFTGRTRSGKSVAVYTALAGLKGLPVQVCGIDPTGILFNALGEHLGGSSLRVSTLADEEKLGLVLDELVAVMDRRIRDLLALKLDKFGPDDFSAARPVLICVFEEYPGTLAATHALDAAAGRKVADRIETKLRAAIQRLALEGAKAGVFVWLVAQRADAQLLTGVLRSQLTQKFSFAQDDDGLRMLHEGITPEEIEAAQKFLPGQGYVEILGSVPLTQFRADLLDYEGLCRIYAEPSS